ncbi:MAG: patatin-like phospholipase family protein [Acidobacteriota bacterium]
MSKRGLVLSGGGMLAAFQAGEWRALAGRFAPDVVIGASAGALNAWMVAGRVDPEELFRNDSLRVLYSTTWGYWRGAFGGKSAPWRFAGTPTLKTLEACQCASGSFKELVSTSRAESPKKRGPSFKRNPLAAVPLL